MIILSVIFTVIVATVFAIATMVAIVTMGICLKTIVSMAVTILMVGWLTCWLYDTVKKYTRDHN